MSAKLNIERLIGIYKITCLKNGKSYIGATKDHYKRFEKHKWMLKHNQHTNVELQEAWNTYGEINFSFDWLFSCSSRELFIKETEVLKQYGWPDRTKIFNFESGGIKNKHIAKETKQKISVFNKGKHLSEEQRQKISNSHKGKKGHPISEKNKQLTSLRMKKQWQKNSPQCQFLRKKAFELNQKRQTPILQFDLQGNLIQKWPGINFAARVLKIGSSCICDCCKNKRKTYKNFVWKYEKDAC